MNTNSLSRKDYDRLMRLATEEEQCDSVAVGDPSKAVRVSTIIPSISIESGSFMIESEGVCSCPPRRCEIIKTVNGRCPVCFKVRK